MRDLSHSETSFISSGDLQGPSKIDPNAPLPALPPIDKDTVALTVITAIAGAGLWFIYKIGFPLPPVQGG